MLKKLFENLTGLHEKIIQMISNSVIDKAESGVSVISKTKYSDLYKSLGSLKAYEFYQIQNELKEKGIDIKFNASNQKYELNFFN